MAEAIQATPVRGTQSFVYTMAACWRRPSLTALELLWRWGFGIPASALLANEALGVLRATPLDTAALARMSILDPMSAAATLAEAADALWPRALGVARWLVPLLAVAWVVVSAAGRGAVLRRADPRLRSRRGTLMVLHGLRLAAVASVFAAWFACLHGAAAFAVNGPMKAGDEPNLVLYCALAIVATLGWFTLWAVLSWALSVAPLLAMREGLGAWASLRAAFHLGPLREKLVEINLVMGIVKIALIVLAMVLSACPLPFESVATPSFMLWWYAATTVIYLITSDFFHVVQLASYLELWKQVEAPSN